MNLTKYYVYLYLRTDGSPYYVGKGSGNRAWSSNKRVNLPTDLNNIVIVGKNLFETEAFLLEKKLINQFGRKDLNTGILRNLTDGGDGIIGWDGITKSYDERFGKEKSEIVKLKKSKSMIGKNKGKNSALYGKPGTRLGKITTKDHRDKLSAARAGSKNPGYDTTLYKWKHIESDVVYEMTRYEFYKQFNISPSHVCLLIKNIRKTANGFKLDR
jgi:hypothetical protein